MISDIVMAGEMNGLDLARKLRELYPELPVMLATATAIWRMSPQKNSR